MNLKTSFVTNLLPAFAALAILSSTSTGLAQTNPKAKVWSNTIKCFVNSVEYYDFSKADPLVSMYPGLGNRDAEITIMLTTGEHKITTGSLKIPGTNFQIDIDKIYFMNRIAGVPTESKSLALRTILRQDGDIIASAEGDERGADTHAFVTVVNTMTPNLSVEADICVADSYKLSKPKNMADCLRELAPTKQVVVTEARVICFASKDEWPKK